MDPLQTGILERFRKQKARIGSVALTLFLAGLLNLLAQPCLMAAPIDDCHESAVNHQSVLPSDSAATLTDYVGNEFSALADCLSMQGCADWDVSHSVIPSPDLEKKYFASVELPTQIQPGPVSFSLTMADQEPLFSRVPLFSKNCALLI